MILVRDIFQLKFGRTKEAVALWKEGSAIIKKLGYGPERLLTDLIGPSYYTFVMESTFESLADLEKELSRVFANEEWSQWYQKFLPLVESGRREIFNIVE
jgi:hypothetical protein